MKGRVATENRPGEQMRLSQEGASLESRVGALAGDPLLIFLERFQIVQHHALKLATPVWVGRGLIHFLQCQSDVALENLGLERLRSAEKAVGELFNLSDAELFATEGGDVSPAA